MSPIRRYAVTAASSPRMAGPYGMSTGMWSSTTPISATWVWISTVSGSPRGAGWAGLTAAWCRWCQWWNSRRNGFVSTEASLVFNSERRRQNVTAARRWLAAQPGRAATEIWTASRVPIYHHLATHVHEISDLLRSVCGGRALRVCVGLGGTEGDVSRA